ncbi:MAG: T9SS type A sorting domain-containing protein [Bacteroidales bacterium]
MKSILLSAALFFVFVTSFAQLSGSYNIPSDPPGFTTVNEAVSELNTLGITGLVTFNIAAGYTENITQPILVTATGNAVNTIEFRKDGYGSNPRITRTDAGALATSTLGGQGDAVIIIEGSDYVTFNGIDVAATNQGIEYGYYLRKASATDGCKHVTIKNCVVEMTKGNSNFVVGIYSSNNIATSAVNSAIGVTVTSTGGRHENIRLTANTIKNVHLGILMRGSFHFDPPHDFLDQNFIIGAEGEGNIIQNYGGGSTTASHGIMLINHTSPKISYNEIDNAGDGGGNATGPLYGITMSSSIFPGDVVIENNSITLNQGSTSLANGITITPAGNSVNVTGNIFSYGVFASTTTSSIISCNNATNNVLVTDNITTGAINRTGPSGLFYGFYNNANPSGGIAQIQNNNFNNITITGTSRFYGIYHNGSLSQTKVISGNTVSNITAGTGEVYGIYSDFHNNGSQIHSNIVSDLSNSGNPLVCYFIGANASGSFNFAGNECFNISSSADGDIIGINCLAPEGAEIHLYKNKVFSISGTAAGTRVIGLRILPGAEVFAYNNYIYGLEAPFSTNVSAANGILIANDAYHTSAYYLFYNTIYLNAISASETTFGTSGINAGTTQKLEMKNNIIVNTSTPGPAGGSTVAYRRTNAELSTYLFSSDNNDLFAGTPSAANLIYFDGTNAIETMEGYKALVTPRDAYSISEMPAFENISTTPFDLHINPKVETLLESGAIPPISAISITKDFDGDPRSELFPDIGADEFQGVGIDINPPHIIFKPFSSTVSTAPRILDITVGDPSGVPSTGAGIPVLYWKINDGPFADVTPIYLGDNQYRYTFGGGVAPGDKVSYYIVARDEANNPHIGSSPAGAVGFTWDPPAASIPPVVLHSYFVNTAITSFPYHEGFESSKAVNWTTGIFSGTANDWVIGTPAKAQLSGAYSGANAYVTKTTGITSHNHNAYILSPHFDFTILDHPMISFWHNFNTEYWFDACIVEYTIDNGTTWHKLNNKQGSGSNFTTVKSYNWYNSSNANGPISPPKFNYFSTAYAGHQSGWIQSTSDLKEFSGEIIQFRFRYGTDESNYFNESEGWAIDDVEVYNLGVVRPTALAATTISDEQIDLSFHANAFNNNVVIVWNTSSEFIDPQGLPPSQGSTFAGGILLHNGTGSPVSHSGLDPNTKYYYRAFSYDGLDYSPGINAQAATFCVAVSSLPWSEGFESASVPFIPGCWFRETNKWVTAKNSSSGYDADARTGTQFLRISWLAIEEYIWTSGFDLEGGTSYDFSFWWAGDGYTGWTGDVFYNTDPVSTGAIQLGNSFVTDDITTTLDYAQAVYNFSPVESGTYYFAIRVNCPTNIPWYLSFDDFSLDVTTGGIDCPPPIAGNITTVYNGEVHTGTATVPLGASVVWYDAPVGGNVTTDPSGINAGTYTAWAETVDPGAGCTSDTRTQVSVTIQPVTLDFRVMLQGPYNAGMMNTDLYDAGQIPANQPFNAAPWNYTGTETATPTASTIDWILVELRSGTGPETMFERFACLLNNDGIVSLVINDIDYPDIHGGDSCYLVIWHRNHMPLMSATAKTLPVAEFDLSSLSNIYGTNAAVQLGAGVYGMIAGDITNDGILQYSGPGNDRGPIISRIVNESGSSNLNGWITNGYWHEDLNLNNFVLYIGSANDRGYIVENLNILTGEPFLTNLYYSIVPGAVPTAKTQTGNEGAFDLVLSSPKETVNVDILNNELLTNGMVDNIQFTLCWKSGDNEIKELIGSYQSEFMLAPQGGIKESGGFSYKVFASVTPVYLPDPFSKGEKITVITFENLEQVMITGRLWIAEDSFTAAQNGMYYVSVWGHDNTGSILAPGLQVSDAEGLTEFRIYPNPVMQSHVNVSFTSLIRQKIVISVYNMLGVRVAQDQLIVMANETTTTQLDLKGLPPGTYMVNLSGENTVFRDLLIIR